MSTPQTLTTATPTAPTSAPVPARRSGRRGEEIAKILFVVPAALTMIALFGYPVVKNLVMSFQNYTLRRSSAARLRGWGCRTMWPW